MSSDLVVREATSVVASALRDIHNAYKSLTPVNVVNVARDPSSPLHDHFEWDDSVAGERFRLIQAAQLIRSVKVTIVPANTQEPIAVRAYVAARDVTQGATPGEYVPIENVAGNTAFQVSLKESIERDLERLRNKYAATADYFDAIAQEWADALNETLALEAEATSAA